MSRPTKGRSRRTAGTIPQLAWKSVINNYPPAEPLSVDHVESIHEASMTVLESMGIRVLHRGARALFATAGADQPACRTPFTLASAMGRVTLAGALTLQNAEKRNRILTTTSDKTSGTCHLLPYSGTTINRQ